MEWTHGTQQSELSFKMMFILTPQVGKKILFDYNVYVFNFTFFKCQQIIFGRVVCLSSDILFKVRIFTFQVKILILVKKNDFGKIVKELSQLSNCDFFRRMLTSATNSCQARKSIIPKSRVSKLRAHYPLQLTFKELKSAEFNIPPPLLRIHNIIHYF